MSGAGNSGQSSSPVVVTYTVQDSDTLGGIATLLSSSVDEIMSFNNRLIKNPDEIEVGWVLFVPVGSDIVNGTGIPDQGT